MKNGETLYHVTVLSNLARGYDKYSNSYSKRGLPESTYPNRFYLLKLDELDIGLRKASRLLHKLGLPGNRAVVLETEIESRRLHPNTRTGLGRFVDSDRITLKHIHEMDDDDPPDGTSIHLRSLPTEDALAASLSLLDSEFHAFPRIRPRSVSFLPVALACQASCPFCFSKASVSSDQAPSKPDWHIVDDWLTLARERGAERAVITGGGEPTLLGQAPLLEMIRTCSNRFDKVVLITNGHTLATPASNPKAKLRALSEAGLKVLAISRHHHEQDRNRGIMHLDTSIDALLEIWHRHRSAWPSLRIRLICVLQRHGVESLPSLEAYVTWAARNKIEEICFKELYVSTSAESVYHDRAANDWSRRHQVPLSLVTRFAERHGFAVESRLPWNAPVFQGCWEGRTMRIATYTEPGLFWERKNGIARSWNVMADGRCYVSLEDRASQVALEDFA